MTYKREKSGQRPFVANAPFFYPSGIVSDIIENKEKKKFRFGSSRSEAGMSYFGPVQCPSKIGTHREEREKFLSPRHTTKRARSELTASL